MLLSRKSSHHIYNTMPPKQPLNKKLSEEQKQIKIAMQDIRELSDTKHVEENMLNKLLRPPIKKQNKSQRKKYDPQFQKPDIQSLIHDNNQYKNKLSQNEKVIKELKFKIREQERKIEKLESNYFENVDDFLDKNKANTSAHTEILKKKIHDLHIKNINTETEIKRLKKLPATTIFEENNIQKQHLLAETIRLKSILASYECPIPLQLEKTSKTASKQENTEVGDLGIGSVKNNKFQQQFLRMLKQQNEKLKATIRLLQNDKMLMKSRQTTQAKQISDIKKEVEQIKVKLIQKQAQIQKLTHENQNLLFKKAAKFRAQKEERENKIIEELTKSIQELKSEKRKLENERADLQNDNLELKKKEQDRNILLYERDKEMDKLKIEISEIKGEFQARINSLQMNKLYSKESSFGIKSSKDNENMNSMRFGCEANLSTFSWGKPVKFQDIDFCLLKLWTMKNQGVIERYEDLFVPLENKVSRQDDKVGYQDVYKLFKSSPIKLPSKHSLKLTKFIMCDHCEFKQNFEQPKISISLILTILKASINRFTQCLSKQKVISEWKCALLRSRKLIKQLQEINKEYINKDCLIQILLRNKNNSLEAEQINFVLLHSFALFASTEQIMLSIKKVLQVFYTLIGDRSKNSSHLIKDNSSIQSIHRLTNNQIQSLNQIVYGRESPELQKKSSNHSHQTKIDRSFRSNYSNKIFDQPSVSEIKDSFKELKVKKIETQEDDQKSLKQLQGQINEKIRRKSLFCNINSIKTLQKQNANKINQFLAKEEGSQDSSSISSKQKSGTPSNSNTLQEKNEEEQYEQDEQSGQKEEQIRDQDLCSFLDRQARKLTQLHRKRQAQEQSYGSESNDSEQSIKE